MEFVRRRLLSVTPENQKAEKPDNAGGCDSLLPAKWGFLPTRPVFNVAFKQTPALGNPSGA